MEIAPLESFFYVDHLAQTMALFVIFIGLVVGSFSTRYLQGDSRFRSFFFWLVVTCAGGIGTAFSNRLELFLASWACTNAAFLRLMRHNSGWPAARASARLAATHFAFGFLCLLGAFALLVASTGHSSIQGILHTPSAHRAWTLSALFLLLLGAMVQSGIWPFHRWLTSSLNAPTPVLALLHASSVASGGFLLSRFAPLYLAHSFSLHVLFAVGILTAFLGALWKLIQHDVKRMHACSTMGHMGFTFAQCGLGLFPVAVGHLCWHGLFKAMLFLASGSAAHERRFPTSYHTTTLQFLLSLFLGGVGSYTFALVSQKAWLTLDTTFVLVFVAFLAATQFAVVALGHHPVKNLVWALPLTGLMGVVYGANVFVMQELFEPLAILEPQPLNALHILGLLALTVSWLFMLFGHHFARFWELSPRFRRFYVKVLNASQPHPDTMTTHRNHYKFNSP